MSFLDNSGNLILDAVLTDEGRNRMAKGDGTFKIVKFRLGDDEIDYSLYDTAASSNTQAATVLKTPIFEAMTKNTVALKHALYSMARTDLLHLPVLKINTLFSSTKQTSLGNYLVGVDEATRDSLLGSGSVEGIMDGFTPQTQFIRIDQGLDTTDISYSTPMNSSEMTYESTYEIQIDNRFASLLDSDNRQTSPRRVDADDIAFYYVSVGEENKFVSEINNTTDTSQMVIAGPRGTKLEFKLVASRDLQTSTAKFIKLGRTQLGSQIGAPPSASSVSFRTIDATIKITGMDTGYQIDVPVKFAKKV